MINKENEQEYSLLVGIMPDIFMLAVFLEVIIHVVWSIQYKEPIFIGEAAHDLLVISGVVVPIIWSIYRIIDTLTEKRRGNKDEECR